MGGHQGGEVASALAVEAMYLSLQKTKEDDLTPVADEQGHYSTSARRLAIAVQQANEEVIGRSQQEPSLTGMGTTVAAILFDAKEQLASICHVGDSRVYRVREGAIEQLTEDHSLVQQLFREGTLSQQEMKTSPHRHILTQAVGAQALLQPGVRFETPRSGDVFMLCSDGIHGEIQAEEMLTLFGQHKADLQHVCDLLVDLANDRGGRDNSTILIVGCEEGHN
jgi:protein phosphatase